MAHPSVTLTADEPSRLVSSLAELGIKSVWLMGGGKVAASFRQSGLISRYIIAVMPIILGTGIPLLAAVPGQDVLTLIEAKPYPSGIVQLHYESKLG
ncbi:MAG: dihydrofolate reductase family protein [Pseudomonadales bacterium]